MQWRCFARGYTTEPKYEKAVHRMIPVRRRVSYSVDGAVSDPASGSGHPQDRLCDLHKYQKPDWFLAKLAYCCMPANPYHSFRPS